MTHLALFVLLRLISKYSDLLSLAVLKNLGGNGCLCAILAGFDALVITYSKNVIKGYFCISLSAELLNVNNVALGNLILLAAGYDNSVHRFYLPLFRLAMAGEHAFLKYLQYAA